jgi:hypothetical protein
LRLGNESDFSDDFIRDVVREVCPSGLTNFLVMVYSRPYDIKRYRGFERGGGSYVHRSNRSSGHAKTQPMFRIDEKRRFSSKQMQAIIVNITTADAKYPLKESHRKGVGYLNALHLNREEHLVHLIAHELRHLWQYHHPKGWRVWGARGRYSERDADAYAIRETRAYHRRHPPSLDFTEAFETLYPSGTQAG